MASPGSNLGVSRINRLLRPLRNKCNSLTSAYATSNIGNGCVPASTYSNDGSEWPNSTSPPLALLQSPIGAVSKLHVDENYIQTLALSGAIYGVRDCFKNLVQVAVGASDKPSGIASLGAICSMVIGNTLQVENDSRITAMGDNDHLDDEEIMEIVNNVYEAIPSRYRRFVLHVRFHELN